MLKFAIDIAILSLMISGIWSLVAILFRLHIIWLYWLTTILPFSIFVAVGLKYFKVIECLSKLISN